MHHLYPSVKGDPLCPLGFHPQVRWPTRCKRCFRDYKEHGGRKKDDDAAGSGASLRKDDRTSSTPSLSSWATPARSWTSSSNLSTMQPENKAPDTVPVTVVASRPASWTSTPDLANLKDDTHAAVPTVSVSLPRRKLVSQASTMPERALAAVPESAASSRTKRAVASANAPKRTPSAGAGRIQVKELRAATDEPTNHDVQFLIQVKARANDAARAAEEDTASVAATDATDTTDTTLVDDRSDTELHEQIESLRRELEVTKARCEKAERERSDLMLRRLATYESTSSKTTASEVLKLQQRCNELSSQLEDMRDSNRGLGHRVRELQTDLEQRPDAQAMARTHEELRGKLNAAETLCEELMDENEDMKKELRELEDEMEEMQDNFREDQADEYSSLKKELEQTTKNCRILSFKLRKTERRLEQAENDRLESERRFSEVSGGKSVLDQAERVRKLEQELSVANEVSRRLQVELDDANQKMTKTRPPGLGTLGRASSGDGKVSRESLTRGGSQEDPVQLLRDLHDSLEREADLREQLRFAEEEAQNLRKKGSRLEDDNESLALQLKKMATKARSRKLSPTPVKATPEPSVDKDEGISDDDDPAELRLLLELSEQECSVLRRRVEDLEHETDVASKKVKDTQDRLDSMKQLSNKKIPPKTSLGSSAPSSVQEHKVKVLEDETCELRKKLIEKERDCERLHAELSINQKRSKGMQKSKSLDGDQQQQQQTLDLRRQVQLVEQEAVVLRAKLQSLEVDNEKLTAENKKLLLTRGSSVTRKFGVSDKSSEKIAALEVELEGAKKKMAELTSDGHELSQVKQQLEEALAQKQKLTDKLEYMNADATKALRIRIPKRPTELSTKLQLKNMVLDLEKEIGETLIVFRNCEKAKLKLEEEASKKKEGNAVEELRKQVEALERTVVEHKKAIAEEKRKYDELDTKYRETIKKYDTDKVKCRTETNNANEQIKKLEQEITALNTKLELATKKKEDAIKSTQTITSLKLTLAEKDSVMATMKKELESLKTIANEKNTTIETLEKEAKERDEKIKKSEKLLSTRKEKNATLEKELESLREKLDEKDKRWCSDKFALEASVSAKERIIEELNVQMATKSSAVETNLRSQLTELVTQVESLKSSKTLVEDNLSRLEAEKTSWEKKTAELETNVQAEKKKMERMKGNHEKEQKNRELELNALKSKIHSLEQRKTGSEDSKLLKQEHEEQVKKLDEKLSAERRQYEELTAKYEILEEEHVVTKAQLVMEKESLSSELVQVRQDMSCVEGELQALRDTYSTNHDAWFKEKLSLEQQVKELSQKGAETVAAEKARLRLAVDEKNSELEHAKKATEVIEDQLKNARKEIEDLKQKLDDFDRVTKVQRSMNADSSALEKQSEELRAKLGQAEKSRKAELVECKMRYDNQLSIVHEELRSLQAHVARFKKERDTYRHMLDGAQKQLLLARTSTTAPALADGDGEEMGGARLATLEQQVGCMEDELSEARLECSRLKTELVSERSTWEVRMSEMKSRINELEEERLLSSGRTKTAGLRTRMELAWQKEREEQQRLLQETSTLARDLRQTLFEVERERDKERLEAKRKQDQLKRSVDDENEENRRKLHELQCDLLELRDAHAKLRTTNEKLRREKEKNEREREELRSVAATKRKNDQEDDKRMNLLLDQVESLLRLVPQSQPQVADTPTPPRRTRQSSRSRESSPAAATAAAGNRETSRERSIGQELRRLRDTITEARRDRDKTRNSATRSTVASPDGDSNGLKRRSLSLDQSARVWHAEDDGSLSSMQSLDMADAASDMETERHMDSRLSGGSTQSEMTEGVGKKKKKSLMGKLKKLTKSRSIDDQSGVSSATTNLSYHTGGSDCSINEDPHRTPKRDLKERLTGMFKRSGSSSRSNSLERRTGAGDSSSLQRPLTRNGSSNSVTRPSPARSDTSTSRYK